MATAGPLAHFIGPDVLDPLFQQMRARGLAPREVQRRILEALKREKLIILARVAAGAWSLQAREYATREEEVQAQQEAMAATEKYDWNAYHAILFEQSPSPDGIIGPIVPESWEVTIIIAIRDGHLVIELLEPKFPPESYSFAIASPEAVDELLAAAHPSSRSATKPPRPGSADFWIGELFPNEAWRPLKPPRIHRTIEQEIEKRNAELVQKAKSRNEKATLLEHVSLTAVRDALKRRLER
jgi:hypothetical protein